MNEDYSCHVKTEPLNEPNYYTWKRKAALVLSLDDLDEHIVDDLPTVRQALLKQTRMHRKAQVVIGISISDEHLDHVRSILYLRKK